MEHVVLNKYGKPYKVGDEVIVIDINHSMHNKVGEIHKVRNYDNDPRLSVVFECGNVYGCKPEQLTPN